MFELFFFHVVVFMTLVTSGMGAVCILRRLKIFELRSGGRNFMAAGALCAMPFGFIGATACVNLGAATPSHYLAAVGLGVIGLCATTHIYLDLFDRVSILKRS